jgi:hypothetical protein
MIERCLLASTEIADLDVINTATVTDVVSKMDKISVTHMIVTDQNGVGIYDSVSEDSTVGKYTSLPEVDQALQGYDVFTWDYHAGTMHSRAATPIYSYGVLIGCIYMTELDVQQGNLIQTLQHNTVLATLILESILILQKIEFEL